MFALNPVEWLLLLPLFLMLACACVVLGALSYDALEAMHYAKRHKVIGGVAGVVMGGLSAALFFA
jgi:hypothetical protein